MRLFGHIIFINYTHKQLLVNEIFNNLIITNQNSFEVIWKPHVIEVWNCIVIF